MSGHKPKNIPGATELQVSSLHPQPGLLIACIRGTLDATTSADLDTRFKTLLKQVPQSFLLDLGAVDYISSMGLSVVLKTIIRLKNAGVVCWFYDPHLSVRRVLQISKWDHLILDPATVPSQNPFFSYICDEEPTRATRRRPAPVDPPRLITD